jgi:RHS repeat-associated protein
MGIYDAFGNIVAVTGSTAESDRFIFGFAGGLWDPTTKLVQFGARTYDPEIGRWLERDPSLHKGGVNLYEYAEGDPLNWIDENGEKRQQFFPRVDASLEDSDSEYSLERGLCSMPEEPVFVDDFLMHKPFEETFSSDSSECEACKVDVSGRGQSCLVRARSSAEEAYCKGKYDVGSNCRNACN